MLAVFKELPYYAESNQKIADKKKAEGIIKKLYRKAVLTVQNEAVTAT